MPRTTERRSVTRLDPEVRRTQIVQAAAALFATRDPAEVPFEEIADAAGVSRALVYNYFGDRGGLLAAVYLHQFEAVWERLVEAAEGLHGTDRIRAIVEAYLDVATTCPSAWRLLRTARVLDHPLVQESRRKRMQAVAALWGGTPEALIVACALTGMLEEATIEWLQSSTGVDRDRMADVLHGLMWGGVASLEASLDAREVGGVAARQ